ncbi:hypothetical protein, partial [Francisella tularensis]|uniref:hypothetical protein n=1 Tax=Francisella tularensis TaxID=263 RepID=UPI001CC30788
SHLCLYVTDLANAYACFGCGYIKTGKSASIIINRCVSISSSVSPTTIQSMSVGDMYHIITLTTSPNN